MHFMEIFHSSSKNEIHVCAQNTNYIISVILHTSGMLLHLHLDSKDQ